MTQEPLPMETPTQPNPPPRPNIRDPKVLRSAAEACFDELRSPGISKIISGGIPTPNSSKSSTAATCPTRLIGR